MDPNNTRYEMVDGAGGDTEQMPDEMLSSLRAEIDRLVLRCSYFADQRYRNEVLRYNQWDGNRLDGRNWSPNAEHFPGQSDQSVWMIDSIINERVQQSIIALSRAQIRCEPRGLGADAAKANKWTIILRWLVGRMGAKWFDEHVKLWNYEDTDTPAVALMRVYWRTDMGLEMKTLTAEEIAQQWASEYVQQMQGAGQEVAQAQVNDLMLQFLGFMMDDGSDKAAVADMVSKMFPRLNPKRAKKIATQVSKTGTAEFPLPIVAFDGPEISARRFAQDFFVPDSCADFNDCQCWFEVEWIGGTELRAREKTMGWSKEFIEEVEKHRGEAVFPDAFTQYPSWFANYTPMLHDNEYQVIWAHFQATSEDGVPARYYAVLGYTSHITAFGMRLDDGPPNKWPAVFHRRETVDRFALNSRGIPEIVGPEQSTIKRLRDTQIDSAEIAALPPFTTNDGRGSEDVFLGALKHIALQRPGSEAKFLQPPQPPVEARNVAGEISRDVAGYWGRKNEQTDPNMLAMRQEFDVLMRLSRVEDELQLILDLAKIHLPDDMLVNIVGPDKMPVARSREELAGQYDVRIVFDPAQMDYERVTAIINALPAIKQLDPGNTIDMTPAAQYGLRALLPQLAEEAIRPADVGTAKEEGEAKNHLILMRNGMQVPVDESGAWNYELRIKTIENALQSDPDLNSIPPAYLQNISAYIEALKFQYQQHVINKQTGRQGAKGATGPMAPDNGSEGPATE